MKNLTKKGFTLIELMIVVVILGVLMSTIVPKLVGAQARGRDTGRKADLRNIETVLATYYSDYGTYPSANTGECLKASIAFPPARGTAVATPDNYVTGQIQSYFKGGKVVTDPSKGANSQLCNAAYHVGAENRAGQYWYKSLKKADVEDGGYILCADMEVPMNANTIVVAATGMTPLTGQLVITAAMLAKADLTVNAETSGNQVQDCVDNATGPLMITAEDDTAHSGNSVYCVVM